MLLIINYSLDLLRFVVFTLNNKQTPSNFTLVSIHSVVLFPLNLLHLYYTFVHGQTKNLRIDPTENILAEKKEWGQKTGY